MRRFPTWSATPARRDEAPRVEIERTRQARPREARILVTLWHACQTIGDGSDRYGTAVETFPQPPARRPRPQPARPVRDPPDAAARHPGRAADARPPAPEPWSAAATPPLPARRAHRPLRGAVGGRQRRLQRRWDNCAERRFLRMVQTLSGLPGCLFVVCPDVVGEAGLTSMLFEVATNPSGLGCRVRPAADVCSNRRTTTRPSSARGYGWAAAAKCSP